MTETGTVHDAPTEAFQVATGSRPAGPAERGLLVGLLVGEGTFGGDGKQPHVTLRMHVRHQALFEWIDRTFPGGKLYGPYLHGERHYYQWMARGAFLRDEIVPILDRMLSPELDHHSYERYLLMKSRYARHLEPRRPLPIEAQQR